ncbi:MAG: FAD-dependent oxidoreductase [Gammaproteobacteria bacterium]|nr:FAD-dependent oxidoreductase [Gammaproteobacteria bacterium]
MASAPDSVLVVGAGIIGIACAHYLSRAGFSVSVIDQGRVGGGCSHGNCGHICASHVLPMTDPAALREGLMSLVRRDAPFKVRPQWRVAMLWWLLQFARRCTRRRMLEAARHQQAILESSRREYGALVDAGEIDGEWRGDGLLYVLQSPKGMAAFAAMDAMLSDEFGVAARRLEGEQLRGFDPALRTGLAGAFHYAGDASVRPDVLVSEWAAALRDRGVRFEENRRLTAVRTRSGAVVSMETDRGPVDADHYVIATGAWSARLASTFGAALPLEPGKGYSLTMSSPAECPKHPMLFPEHRVGVTPFRDGFRLGSMLELCGFDASIPRRRIAQLVASASHYLVEPEGAEVRETWSGWRPITWDSLPVIGRMPSFRNVVLATGHHMLGMTMAPATGRLVAEIIGERTPHIDPAPFSPGRF